MRWIMHPVRKSLRARFTLVIFISAFMPLLAVSVFFYFSTRDALFRNVFREMKWNADELARSVEGHFRQTMNDLLIASQNTAFVMYYLDPANRERWLAGQKRTLAYLRSLYPEMLDEACYIDRSGREVARIVMDEISADEDLSSDEGRTAFFKKAFELGDGEVLLGAPTISEDTKRWVMPHATPIFVRGEKMAILHFEIAMSYFQRLLKDSINPERGYGFILNDAGEFVANTRMEMSETGPLPGAVTSRTPPELRSVLEKMEAGESGVERFSTAEGEFYIIFRPVMSDYGKGRNENRWSIGYVISGERLYVETSVIRDYMLVIAGTVLFAVALAYVLGNYVTRPIRALAGAAGRLAVGETPRIELDAEDELGVLSRSFNRMAEAVRRRDEALREMAITDGLTGLYNHRHFKDELEREFSGARRYNRPLSLIIADVDWFKHYNDSHGHIQGDNALKKVAALLRGTTREIDLVARYGGEEFVVVLPETDLDGAIRVAERIRRCVQEEVFAHEETQPGGDFTLSLGAASLSPRMLNASDLVEEADRALYNAKKLGRNRVCPASGA